MNMLAGYELQKGEQSVLEVALKYGYLSPITALELEDKILLLESFGGTVAKIETYLSQLQQIGAFEKITGILLGTFTEM